MTPLTVNRLVIASLGVLALACGPGGAATSAATGEATSSESSPSSSSEVTSSGVSESSSGSETETGAETETETGTAETGTETGTDAGGPICGDGVVEAGESCDDGNALGGDGCPPDCVIPPMACGNPVFACGDTFDNDGDGWIDLYDPDCTSPCDDTEDSFDQQLPGFDPECDGDCRWDANTGQGDDHCSRDVRCDPLSPGDAYGCAHDPNLGPAQCPAQQGDPMCAESCLPLTPNGCDCFGCCEIDGVFRDLSFRSQCTSDEIDACPACTPAQDCFNPCAPDECELCMLQTPAELAMGCAEPSCAPGVTPCTDPYACAEGLICQTGCCLPITIL